MSTDISSTVYTSRPSAIETAETASALKRTSRPAFLGKRGVFVFGATAAVLTAASLMLGSMTPKGATNLLTYTVGRGDLLMTVTEDGTLESARNKEIKCQVKGGSTILWIIADGTEVQPGDELVRLDASTIEDNIGEQQIAYQTALATKVKSESDLAVAEINVSEYLEGTFPKEMQTAESNVAIAEENLRVAQNALAYSEKMFRKGYVGELEVDTNRYSVEYAELQLALKKTELDVLERFTKPKKVQELQSALKAAKAKLASDEAALKLEEERLKRLEQQREACVVHADASGVVIYPETEEWMNEPAIEEGSTVREQQTLLQIPDLSHMQVKVGIHESKVRQLKPGMPARIKIQNAWHAGEVVSIATQVSPSGWWDGNVRRFETLVKLDGQPDVRPGMSAEVEIIVARHEDVLTIPVAAVLEQEAAFYCWVDTVGGPQKRDLELGDSNDQFILVKEGVSLGDRVVLNPLAFIEDAQDDAQKPTEETESQTPQTHHSVAT